MNDNDNEKNMKTMLARVQALPREELESVVTGVIETLYPDGDMEYEWGSGTLQDVSLVLETAAILPDSEPPSTHYYLREAQLSYARTNIRLNETKIRASTHVVEVLKKRIGWNIAESFIVMALVNGELVGIHEVARGAVNAVGVTPADVFRYPLIVGANAVILAHNHPSGRLEASREDIALTERACEAGELLGIHVLDHVIANGELSVSLLDQGLMPKARVRV